MKQKNLFIFLFLFMQMLAIGQTFVVDNLKYTVTSGTNVSVAKNDSNCPTGVLNIPASVVNNGTTYSVTEFASEAFYICTSLTSVTIPNSVTSIGESAFRACQSLTSVTIPNSVTTIGDKAFQNCTSLTSVTIPNSVTSIAEWAFYACSSLSSLTIPNSVTSIGNNAFSYCTSLTSVTIGNSVTSIGQEAFTHCSSLTSIVIPNSVTSLGNAVFRNCYSLTSVTIPNSVTSIGGSAFKQCTSLSSLTIPNSVTSIGNYAFNICTSLTSVTIGNSVTTIGYGAFWNCTSLTSVSIPNSVTTIGNSVFYYCTSLTSVTIPNSVTSIGTNAFNQCTSLTSVTCEIENPLTIYASFFSQVPLPNATLYVPAASVIAYQNATVWQDFGMILPISEVAPTTSLESLCDATLPSFSTPLVFTAVAQATEYRFSITDVVTNEEQFVTSSENFFYLTDLESFAFNTIYSVKAQLKIDGVYGEFGAACNVTSPMPVTTQLRPQFCNYTLLTTNANVYASNVLGATAYKFKVTFNGNEQEVERPDSRFSMGFAEGILPNTTYQVSVSVYLGGAWHPYGDVCNLSTPANFPTTQLRAEYCNSTLATINDNLYADVLVGATGYKFKVANGGNEQEIDRLDNRFSMAFATGIMVGTTYEISVSMFLGGEWQPYGSICTVTTPAALPTTQLRSSFCNGTVLSLGSNFYASVRVGATAYKFKTMINGEEIEVVRPDSRCFMSAFPGAMMDQTYSIEVAVQIGGVWSEYGTACNLTVGTSGVSKQDISGATQAFDIKAYPNPFVSQITLSLSNENTQSDIMVYDMTGKMVQSIKTSDNEVTIGENLTAGVYLVQIVQGQEIKNIRIVKQ